MDCHLELVRAGTTSGSLHVLALHGLAIFQDRAAALAAEFPVEEGSGAVVCFVDLRFGFACDSEARGGEFRSRSVRSAEEFL
jgi:hypothetical protein